MDRPTTRRRRHAESAGSVSVADLLARTTPAEKASVSAIQARAAAEATARAAEEARVRAVSPDAAVVHVTHSGDQAASGSGEEYRASNRLARTIMVVTAVMLACGVVTAVAVFSGQQPNGPSPSIPTVGPTEITGATVVRPDLVNEQLAAGSLPAGKNEASDPDGAPQPGEDVRAGQLTATGVAPIEPSNQQVDPTTPTEQIRRFIVDFYKAAEASPERAFEMLGPQMQGAGLASFVAGWDELLVEVQDLAVSGRAARAVVVIAWRDATVLRTEQLLFVSEGPQPKIVRARLLSAHRS